MKRKEKIKEAAYEAKAKHIGYGDSVVYAFIDGALWADSHANWISVENELPNKLEPVLCTNGHDVKVGFYDCDDSGCHVMWAAPCMGCYDVTHWMPLPTPPTCSEKPNNCKKGGEK